MYVHSLAIAQGIFLAVAVIIVVGIFLLVQRKKVDPNKVVLVLLIIMLAILVGLAFLYAGMVQGG